MNKITLLGTGTSTGVPILGCNCQVCQSNDPRNKRLRTSALIESLSKTLLIDASPDLRTQLLRKNIKNIDAVIITHDHADHTHGMDDLRPYSFIQNQEIPIYCDQYTKLSLEKKFPYIFDKNSIFGERPILGGGIPLLKLNEVNDGFNFNDQRIELYSLPHGYGKTLGIKHSKLAYLVDCHEIPNAVLESLQKNQLDVLIIDCLREAPHETHLTLNQTLEYIAKISPKIAVLTHLAHDFEFLTLQRKLIERNVKNVLIGLDGMSFYYS